MIVNSIKKRFFLDRLKGEAFAAALIAGILTHIYYMVNLPGSEDSILMNYTRPDFSAQGLLGGANTGRWLGPLIDLAGSWYRSFYVTGWFTILAMACVALVLVDLFDIKSRVAAVLSAVFLEVYPAAQAYIVLGEISYPIASLMAPAAALLVVRAAASGQKRGLVWATVLLGLSLVVIPTSMSCFITLILIRMILDLADRPRVSARDMGKLFGHSVLVLLIGGVFLLVSSKMISAAVGSPATSYQGAETAVSGAFLGSIGMNFIQVYKKFIVQGLWKIQIMPRLRWTVYLAYIGTFGGAICLWRRGGRPGGGKRLLSIVVLCLMIPVGLCTITLISYGFMYRGQHRLPLGFLLISFIVVMERLCRNAGKNTGSAGEKGSKMTIRFLCAGLLDVCLMLYGFFLYDNIGYQVQLYVQEKDSSLCTRILSALDQREDFSYDQPVYFVNILDWDGNHDVGVLQYDPELYSVIWPVATSNMYAYGDISVRGYMAKVNGVELVTPDEAQIAAVDSRHFDEVYKDIPAGTFRIEEVGDVTVVILKTVMPPSVLYG